MGVRPKGGEVAQAGALLAHQESESNFAFDQREQYPLFCRVVQEPEHTDNDIEKALVELADEDGFGVCVTDR